MRTELLLMLALIALVAVVTAGEDFYAILGVSRDASTNEIRKAFKKIAVELHPDKNKDDPNANEKFTKINRAYEVLKDPELRNRFDVYGEEGLSEDQKNSHNSYQPWSHFNGQFGIYDDDPEIITLDASDFENSVLDAGDNWFINFYSPYCSHCHDLAPSWRRLAKELNGVIRIGAVNCYANQRLCNTEGIEYYPYLLLYPSKEKYNGHHIPEDLIGFALSKHNVYAQKLSEDLLLQASSWDNASITPWLVFFSTEGEDTVSDLNKLKVEISLEHLINVASVVCDEQEALCIKLGHTQGAVFYPPGSFPSSSGKRLSSLDGIELVAEVFELLPEPEVWSQPAVQSALSKLTEEYEPLVVLFLGTDSVSTRNARKKLPALLKGFKIIQVDCQRDQIFCSIYHVHTKSKIALFRSTRSYEIHHGRVTARDMANFVMTSMVSKVVTLSAEDFPSVMQGTERWLIDFFNPACPPCLRLLPEWRKVGESIGGKLAKLGTVDCTMHHELCRQLHISSYPTIMLNNNSEPHWFTGFHTAEQIIDIVNDVLHNDVIKLTPETFQVMVRGRSDKDIWVVDFFAPWCGHCVQLAPVWRKLAKRLKGKAKLASINCVDHAAFCEAQAISAYPTLRLYMAGDSEPNRFSLYQGWLEQSAIYSWIYSHLPSPVLTLNPKMFTEDVLSSREPWIVDFYAPWCGHCTEFAPHFDSLAERLAGKVKSGKLNCDEYWGSCAPALIRAYPTVVFYQGASTKHSSQDPAGIHLNSLDANYIYETVMNIIRSSSITEQVKQEHGREEL